MPKHPINHPGAGDHIHASFLAAQGYIESSISELDGKIVDSNGKVIATGKMLRPTPYWLITFENIPHVKACTLKVYDAKTGTLLASSDPFDTRESFAVPSISYPANGATVSQTFYAYGYTTGANPVQGQVNSPGGVSTGWIAQIQGPPNTPNWIVGFTSIPVDNTGHTTMTIRDSVTTSDFKQSTGLFVQ